MRYNGNQKVKGYLVEEYIYSDIQLMNFYDRYWYIDFNDKRDFIKNYFEIMCNCKYKSRIIDNIFQKNEILLLINYIFEFKSNNNNNNNEKKNEDDMSIDNSNNNENNRNNILNSIDSILIKALYLISESINKTLLYLETNNDENKIKSNLSKFLTIANIFINNISNLNNSNYTLFIIPMISTILTFSQHLIKFKDGKNIENTIEKIKNLLKSESSSLFLKSFSLSIWINIIQKISEKNINIDINKYIGMINTIIHQIVQEYHKPQEKVFSMQMYNSNYNKWNNNKEKEYFEIIYEYLKNLENFSKNNPDLLIKNYSILNEIYNITNIKYYYPPKMRIQFLDIINSLINHLNKNRDKNNVNNYIIEDNNNNDKDDEIMLNDDDIAFLLAGDIDEVEEGFLKFLKDKIMPNIKDILDKFISTENTNVSNKKKILFPLYEENACLYSKIFGILIKYKKITNHLEYPRYIFNQYFNKENDKKNIFDSVFQNVYSNKNEIGKELYIKLPFKLFNEYLEYYNNLIDEILPQQSFVIIIKYFMELFFIGIFINSNHNNNNMNCEQKYCQKILNIINNNKKLLIKEKEKIKNDYKNQIFLSDDNKQRISIYNLLLTLSNLNNDINTNMNNNKIIGELLSHLSIDFNIDQINSELLFELINGPRTKYALMKINKLSNYNNNNFLYNENEINIKLYILSKYLEPYVYSKLNNKFTSYIDDFINNLTGDQIISSIVTMKFLNSLLTSNMKISNKFKNCLQKVYYNTFLLKSKKICNIISIQNKEGQIKENFDDNEINDIIVSYNNKNKINNNRNFFNSLEISLHLKRNIINNFITDIPLDNILSSNLFINLLNYINSNNSFYSKNILEYYGESIYYYVALCTIFRKEDKISKIKNSIESLYDVILNNNKNYNFIGDIKSFYVFIFFLTKINSFICTILKIEDIENNSPNIFEEILLPHSTFIAKTINILECFIFFMYNYIIYMIMGYNCKNRFIHSFILKKLNLIVKRNQPYFNNNFKSYNYNINGNNLEEMNNCIDRYINEKYGKDITINGYKIVDKITNNIKIYIKNDDDINKKIDFIKYVNFDGYQYIIKHSK